MTQQSSDALQVTQGHSQVERSPAPRIHYFDVGCVLRQKLIKFFNGVPPHETVEWIFVHHSVSSTYATELRMKLSRENVSEQQQLYNKQHYITILAVIIIIIVGIIVILKFAMCLYSSKSARESKVT